MYFSRIESVEFIITRQLAIVVQFPNILSSHGVPTCSVCKTVEKGHV